MTATQLYRQVLADLSAIKAYVFLAAGLFLLGALIGILLPEVSRAQIALFREFAEGFRGKSAPALVLAIFLNNVGASALALLAGGLFGLVPLIAALVNGMLLGGFLLYAPTMVWRIFPHGLLELPAVFIAWGIGMWVGLWVLQPGGRLRALKERLIKGMRIFIVLVLPMLAVAALIEGLAAADIPERSQKQTKQIREARWPNPKAASTAIPEARRSSVKERTYALMRAAPGHQVLDLSCGPGIDTFRWPAWSATDRFVGVDIDEDIRHPSQRAGQGRTGQPHRLPPPR
jgi:uncharacterized membrane protein SpoIIM required for sporulation